MQSITKEKNKDTKTGTKRQWPISARTNEELTEQVDDLQNRIGAMEEAMEALIEDLLEDYSKPAEEVDNTQDSDNTEL